MAKKQVRRSRRPRRESALPDELLEWAKTIVDGWLARKNARKHRVSRRK